VALSENASRTRYIIKIKLKLRKWVLKKKSFQLSFERREWAGKSDNGRKTVPHVRGCNSVRSHLSVCRFVMLWLWEALTQKVHLQCVATLSEDTVQARVSWSLGQGQSYRSVKMCLCIKFVGGPPSIQRYSTSCILSVFRQSDTVSCTFTYHTWQFIIFTVTACIFS